MSSRHVVAITLWALAWTAAGLIPASLFAARDGERALARRELAAGLAGTAVFTAAGAWLW